MGVTSSGLDLNDASINVKKRNVVCSHTLLSLGFLSVAHGYHAPPSIILLGNFLRFHVSSDYILGLSCNKPRRTRGNFSMG